MSKRAVKGTGSYRQRKDKTWEYRYFTEYGERKSFYGKLQRDAKAKYDEWKNNNGAISREIFLKDWAKKWLEVYKKGKVAYGTYRNYELYVNSHIVPHFGEIQIRKIRPANIEAFYNKIAHLSASAQNHIYIALKGIFDTAIENKICAISPVRPIKRPRDAKDEIEVFTPEEIKKLLKASKKHAYGYYVSLLLYTGLRSGELRALQWTDIKDGLIEVRRSYSRAEGGCSDKSAKSGKCRFIGISNKLQKVLDSIPRTGIYVININGKEISANTFDRRYKDVLKSAGVDYISPHKCRHTYATYLIRGGADLITVQSLLGHSSVRTTEIYTHVNADDLKRNVSKLGY